MAISNPKVGLPAGDKVITYIFDKAFHPNIKNIKKWLSLWGCSASGIKETENNYRVKQDNSGNYELGTLRTIDIADGISAVVGKIKMATKKRRNSAVRTNPVIDKMHHSKRSNWNDAVRTAKSILEADKLMEENPRRKRSVANEKNPQHFPKTKAGRPRKRGRPSKAKGKMFSRGRKPKILWWVLDLYKQDSLLSTLIGQGTHAEASNEAKGMIGRHIKHKTVTKAMLSGPYYFRPSKEVVRK